MMNESSLFISEKNISIDESVVPYYGRHGCKQYIQNKPVKFGYKLGVAATPLVTVYSSIPTVYNYNKDIRLGGFCRYDSNVKVTNSPRFALRCSYR